MTPRHTSARFALTLTAALLLAVGAGVGISACSSSTDAGTPAAEGGADSGVDSSRIKVDAAPPPVEDAAVAETPEQCLARCDKTFPTSVPKYDAIDTCWAANCKPSCVDQNGMFDAGDVDGGFDGGGAVNDGGTNLCGTEVVSGVDRACDDCTTAYCCPAWQGCYADKDCLDYNTCVNDCPTGP
jgi:hypothetical protein